jgi:hypothetical protein
MRAAKTEHGPAPWHVRARVLDSLANEGFCP